MLPDCLRSDRTFASAKKRASLRLLSYGWAVTSVPRRGAEMTIGRHGGGTVADRASRPADATPRTSTWAHCDARQPRARSSPWACVPDHRKEAETPTQPIRGVGNSLCFTAAWSPAYSTSPQACLSYTYDGCRRYCAAACLPGSASCRLMHRNNCDGGRVTGCRMTTRRKPACLGERPKSALNWGARR
jgi:hypothetical protein